MEGVICRSVILAHGLLPLFSILWRSFCFKNWFLCHCIFIIPSCVLSIIMDSIVPPFYINN